MIAERLIAAPSAAAALAFPNTAGIQQQTVRDPLAEVDGEQSVAASSWTEHPRAQWMAFPEPLRSTPCSIDSGLRRERVSCSRTRSFDDLDPSTLSRMAMRSSTENSVDPVAAALVCDDGNGWNSERYSIGFEPSSWCWPSASDRVSDSEPLATRSWSAERDPAAEYHIGGGHRVLSSIRCGPYGDGKRTQYRCHWPLTMRFGGGIAVRDMDDRCSVDGAHFVVRRAGMVCHVRPSACHSSCTEFR